MSNLDKEKLEETVSILRVICHRRNRVMFETLFKNPSQVIKTTLSNLKEYKEAHERKNGKQCGGEKRKEKK